MVRVAFIINLQDHMNSDIQEATAGIVGGAFQAITLFFFLLNLILRCVTIHIKMLRAIQNQSNSFLYIGSLVEMSLEYFELNSFFFFHRLMRGIESDWFIGTN